ncbi:HPP family protein [Noviherbaspirillum sp.]|uniref:HPP family protein n=1 Tax=Noviherbaspirillum sp. TaxID=1926288 RepID=UPI002FE3CD9F
MKSLFNRLRRYLPEPVKIDARERTRSIVGMLVGLFVTGAASQWLLGAAPGSTWLVAPMGASAVLLFAVPASPLAQPWPMLGGNMISALIGICCAALIPYPLASACIAAGLAISAMFLLRCLHPPGGALALGTALAAPAIAQHEFGQYVGHAILPVVLNAMLLLAAAVAYNNLCGRRYPHFAPDHANQHRTDDLLPTERLGITPADLDAALKQYNQLLDISRDDLEEILLRTEMQVYQRRFGEITCEDIMSRDIVKVEFGTDLQSAWNLMNEHDIKALPVVNRFQRIIGIITQHDFIKQCDINTVEGLAASLRALLTRTLRTHSEKPEVVGQIMTADVQTAFADQPIATLVALFADSGLHHLPIVDRNGRLVGMITQSDLVAALYRARLEQEDAVAPNTRRLRLASLKS